MPNQLLIYLFEIILNTPEIVILCHLTFFIRLVKKNNSNKILINYLFRLLNKTIKLQYHTYWFLNNETENSSTIEINNIKKFIDLFDKEIINIMH